MKVGELRAALRHVSPEIEVMVQVEENGPAKYMTAAQNVYFDSAGSRSLVVLDLHGHRDTSGVSRTKLHAPYGS